MQLRSRRKKAKKPSLARKTHNERFPAEFKGKKGLTRLINALGYSKDGHHRCLEERSGLPRGRYCSQRSPSRLPSTWDSNGIERALLIGSILFILIVEILNSAVEAVVDKASPEKHELAKRAKDMGSAAVLLSLLNAAVIWACVLW